MTEERNDQSDHISGASVDLSCHPWVDLGPTSGLYPGLRRVVRVGGTSVLVHVESDGIFAIENSCPHYQVDLRNGQRRHGYVECPWHHWLINIRTGECLHNPRSAARTFQVVTTAAGADGDRTLIIGNDVLDAIVEGPGHQRA